MSGRRLEGPGYREHRPAPELARWIDCFWTRLPGLAEPGDTYRVLPDGCADVVFDLSDGLDAFVVGPMTQALVIPAQKHARLLGVRFHPGAAGAFLPAPLSTLVDARVALDAIWMDGAEARERVVEADASGRAIEAFEGLIRARLARVGPHFSPRVQALIQSLAQGPESASVASLAAQAGITRQHLRRLFDQHVGYGPKKLARILRLRRALRLLESRGVRTLATVALDAGYYDQAHMNTDFRRLAGGPPLALAE
jgi:AraC-like DNA-binding protein